MDIIFELPNATVSSDPEASKAFASHIQREGWKLGIDHFTVGAYDLHLLEELKPSYLKINAAYLLSLVEGKEEEVSKSSLFTLAELLEIDLIAIAVDSEETVVRLKENGIILMQGFWIAEPKEERS
jgi:EAL domain-containing protein (putative c-di-GMP-specific phosphodiesterase class I)